MSYAYPNMTLKTLKLFIIQLHLQPDVHTPLPLSIVFSFSQNWIVSNLIKRLELLFLGVFACPKASRIQFTCIYNQTPHVKLCIIFQ